MKIEDFDKFLDTKFADNGKLKMQYLKKFEGTVFNEPGWKKFNSNHCDKLNGDEVYLTIRVGLSGIYRMLNIWNSKTNDWDVKVADSSYTIMYKDISEEDLKS